MWLEKWVRYQRDRYLVKCKFVDKTLSEMVGIELYLPEDTSYSICGRYGYIAEYGKDYKDIICNFVKQQADQLQVHKNMIEEFDEWDGIVK